MISGINFMLPSGLKILAIILTTASFSRSNSVESDVFCYEWTIDIMQTHIGIVTQVNVSI